MIVAEMWLVHLFRVNKCSVVLQCNYVSNDAVSWACLVRNRPLSCSCTRNDISEFLET